MKLMVLDGNSILNRSYYGIRPLTTKDGFYTQAIYGFLVTMARLEDEERPDAVCVTFDRREPTFRHLEYEGYKAQRKGMPEELAMQLKEKYTIIIVTHNMQQAARISDKTAFFLLGELIEYDDTQKLFYQPKQKRTEDYISGRFG